MKVRIAFLIIVFISCEKSVMAQCGQRVSGNPQVLSLAIAAMQQSVNVGSPVMVKATMKNISDHDIYVWMEVGSGRQFHVDVHDSNGNLAPDTEEGKKRNGQVDVSQLSPKDLSGSGACVTLKSGETFVQQVTVSSLYDLTKTGKYTIQLEKPDPESTAIDKSNTVTVTVTS